MIVSLPLTANVPLHAPDAVQLVALTEDQASVVGLPTAREAEPSVNVGTAGGVPEYTGRLAVPAADVLNAFVHVNV